MLLAKAERCLTPKTPMRTISFLMCSILLAGVIGCRHPAEGPARTSTPVVSQSSRNEEPKPNDPYFAKFHPKLAPKPTGLLLRPGDRLAICGDSITEQKMYSLLIETYLTVCTPELNISTR